LSSRARTRQAVLELFAGRRGGSIPFADIRDALGGRHTDLAGAVESLVEDGQLVEMGGGRYSLPEAAGVHRGRFRARTSGGGVVHTDSGRLEVRGHETAGALDGDRVEVRRLRGRSGNGRGVVLRVLERAREGISGVLSRSGGGWRLHPLDPTVPGPVPAAVGDGVRVKPGQAVYARLDYGQRKHSATVVRALGDPATPSVLVDAVAAEQGLSDCFPEEALSQARSSASRPVDAEGREDLTDRFVITIDPADARDFDDAIDVEADPEGGWTLRVHIADVAAYVPRGGPLDREARARGTSVYLPDRVIPMLPEELSNGACSLRPGEDRLARTVTLRFDASGERTDLRVAPTVIRSRRRLTYGEADALIRGGNGGDGRLAEHFRPALELARVLMRRTRERGALDIEGREFSVAWDDAGRPAGFHRQEQTESHRLIEMFMVEANRAVADYCGWSSLPVLYRVHPDPDEEARERLDRRLGEMGVEPPQSSGIHPSQLSGLMKRFDGPLGDLVAEAVLRSLRKAEYSPSNDGHFGLALHSYMHFTSPIRRYPDLLVHQVLSELDSGRTPEAGPMGELAAECSYNERRAERAERESMELVALDYLSRRSGVSLDGVVTGVAGFGSFVRLFDVPAEGLVPGRFADSAPGEFRSEGEEVRVVVESADPLERRLTLVPDQG
jgi:ribonuclease R